MCGIGAILRSHAPGSPEAERLRPLLDGRWERILQRTGDDEHDAGTRPYGSAPWSIPESHLDTLEQAIEHRGPDGRGRFRDAAIRDDGTVVEVALVHRRLSIIDHGGGAQPMVSERGPSDKHGLVAVVFNGCIYNHRELRADLQTAGHRFETDHSDTEAILHAWRERGRWGEHADGASAVSGLDGMFACAIWDRVLATLTLARDPIGEKPLYVASGEDNVTIASSSAAAIQRLRRPSAIEAPTLVNTWIRNGFDAGGLGTFDQIPPGMQRCFAGWASDNSRNFINTAPSPSGRQHEITSDDIEPLLDRAVESRLEADVPVACFLSGGVDSSLIARAAHRALGNLSTFSVRMPHEDYDESLAAERVARQLGTTHHTLDCRADPAADLVRLIHQLGLPFADSSLLPTAWCSAAVRAAAPVALSGDGADELFGGYTRHIVAMRLRRAGRLGALMPTPLLPERDPKSLTARLARLARCRASYTEMLAIFPHADLTRLLTPHGRDALDSNARPLVRDPLMRDLHEYLPDDILRKTDTASMAVALEVRAPFLERALVNTATGATLESLLPQLQRKALLRDIARKHFGPEIADRPKMGFAIPIGEWFRSDHGGMRQLLHDHLRSREPFGAPSLGVDAMIDRRAIGRLLKEHDDAGQGAIRPWVGRDHSQRLYCLLVLSIWSKWLDMIPEPVDSQA